MPTRQTTAQSANPRPTKRRAAPSPSPFTKGQQAVLQLLNRHLTDEQLTDIQNLIGKYLADQTDALSREVWQEKGYTQADMEALLNTHVRTPYKKR
jgi:hypothetical protein